MGFFPLDLFRTLNFLTNIQFIYCNFKRGSLIPKPQRTLPGWVACTLLSQYTFQHWRRFWPPSTLFQNSLDFCRLFFRFGFFGFWFVFNPVYLLKNISSPLILKPICDDFVVCDVELVFVFVGRLFRVNMLIKRNFFTFDNFKVVIWFQLLLIL